MIAVTDQFILLEGELMAESTKAVTRGDLKVEQLYEALVDLRTAAEQQPEFEPRIIVQGDRAIEFRLLQKVMYPSQLAGYTQVSLAVLQDEALPTGDARGGDEG